MQSNTDSEESFDDFLGFLVAIHDFDKRSDDELTLCKGDVIEIIENDDEFKDGWYIGKNIRSAQSGLFPKVFTTVYAASPAPLQTNQFVSPLSPNHNNGPLPMQPEMSPNFGKNSVNRTLTDIDEVLSELNGNKIFYGNTDSIYEAQSIESNTHLLDGQESKEQNTVSSTINNWTPQDISAYFQTKGFEPSVCQLFVKHKITGNILLELELPHLKEIEITSFGTRFEIHKVIENLKSIRASPGTPKTVDTTSLCETPIANGLEKSHYRQRSRSMDDLSQYPEESQDRSFGATAHSTPNSFFPTSPESNRPGKHASQSDQLEYNSNASRNYSTSSSTYNEDIRSPSVSQPSLTDKISKDSRNRPINDDNNQNNIDLRNSRAVDETGGLAHPCRYSSITSLGISKTLSSHNSYSSSSSPDMPDNTLYSKKSSPGLGDGSPILGLNEDKRPGTDALSLSNSENPNSQTIPRRSTMSSFRSKSAKKPLLNSSMNPFSSSNSKHQTSAFQEGINAVSPSEATKTADYAGWISKKGSGVGTWRSRYFTLHNTRLSYFVSLNDTKERGLIDITAHKVLPLNQNEDKLISIYAASTGSGKYCFKLVPPGPGSKKGVTFTAPRTHYFAVDSKVEMRAWMGALIKATIDRDESVPAISSCVTPTVSLPRAKQMLREAQEQAILNEATIRSRVSNMENNDSIIAGKFTPTAPHNTSALNGLDFNSVQFSQPNSPTISEFDASGNGNTNGNGTGTGNRLSSRNISSGSFSALSPALSNYSFNSASTRDSNSLKALPPLVSNASNEALELANKTRDLWLSNFNGSPQNNKI